MVGATCSAGRVAVGGVRLLSANRHKCGDLEFRGVPADSLAVRLQFHMSFLIGVEYF